MKKVLIVTYYWPPAGGPGVQRVLKFAKYLPEFGWQPIILTVQDGEYPAIDESLVKEVPQDCDVFRTNSIEPNSIYKKITGIKKDQKIPVAILAEKNLNWIKKISNWIRLNVFIPDAKIGWKPFAVNKGKQIINELKPDLIFSSSPPPTVHLIAKSLKQYSNLKWVADLRDPWTDIYYYHNLKKSKISTQLDMNLELSVFKTADQLCTVSKDLVNIFKNKKPDIDINIITNGYDPEDLPKIRNNEKYNKFTIAYAGKLNNQQNPINLWRALQNLINKNDSFAQEFQIVFMGNFSETIHKSIKEYNLSSHLNDLGYVSHNIALKNLLKSYIKLLIIPDTNNNKGIITGKLFECLATEGFVLGLGSKDGDAAKILDETKAGQMFEYSDDLEQKILLLYEEWKAGIKLEIDRTKIEKYTRKNLTKDLANIFDQLVEN
jgi:glycosyltransferase involved in cell wall biosynthesis